MMSIFLFARIARSNERQRALDVVQFFTRRGSQIFTTTSEGGTIYIYYKSMLFGSSEFR
jgi:hypothetical protein